MYMKNHVQRAPFSDIERKKEVAKSKERRCMIAQLVNIYRFASLPFVCLCVCIVCVTAGVRQCTWYCQLCQFS